jgi:hypothetical protein
MEQDDRWMGFAHASDYSAARQNFKDFLADGLRPFGFGRYPFVSGIHIIL